MIQFENYSVGYRGKTIIENLNLEIRKGERFCLLGPSGSGKTTILNALTGAARFSGIAVSSGTLHIGGNKKQEQPGVGYVFQDLALFPHLNVKENIAFPLRIQGIPKNEIDERVASILDMLKISEKAKARIESLSGGQKQRVALARALVMNPPILCMDEALKGLDTVLKMDFLNKLLEIQEREKFTLVYVTHDLKEANFCAHRICIIDNGKVQQIGTPYELYKHPSNLKVALFTGDTIQFDLDSFTSLRTIIHARPESKNISAVVFRPENIRIENKLFGTEVCVHDERMVFSGKVTTSRFMGKEYRSTIHTGNSSINFFGDCLVPGSSVSFSISIHDLLFY